MQNESGLDVLDVHKYMKFSVMDNHHVVIPIWMVDSICEVDNDDCCVVSEDHDNETTVVKFKNEVSQEKIIDLIVSHFYVSKWYSLLVNDGRSTPLSSFIPLSHVYTHNSLHPIIAELDEHIVMMPHHRAFCRLDTASSKNVVFHTEGASVLADLLSSERTAPIIRSAERGCHTALRHNIVIREYVANIDTMCELRCFVHDKTLRGVCASVLPYGSTTFKDIRDNVHVLRSVLKRFVKRVVGATEYRDCVVDVAIPKELLYSVLNGSLIQQAMAEEDTNMGHSAMVSRVVSSVESQLMVIEINSPCWLLATSGLFSLQLEAHRQILFGPLDTEVVTYPRVILSIERAEMLGYDEIEL